MPGSMPLHHNLFMTPFGVLVGERGGWLPLRGWARIVICFGITDFHIIYDVWYMTSYGHAIGIYEHPTATHEQDVCVFKTFIV
jgi:hypothetical protein